MQTTIDVDAKNNLIEFYNEHQHCLEENNKLDDQIKDLTTDYNILCEKEINMMNEINYYNIKKASLENNMQSYKKVMDMNRTQQKKVEILLNKENELENIFSILNKEIGKVSIKQLDMFNYALTNIVEASLIIEGVIGMKQDNWRLFPCAENSHIVDMKKGKMFPLSYSKLDGEKDGLFVEGLMLLKDYLGEMTKCVVGKFKDKKDIVMEINKMLNNINSNAKFSKKQAQDEKIEKFVKLVLDLLEKIFRVLK